MSLILEALRKLEREKRSSEPGFLVLGPTSWPSATRGARGAVLALIAGLALLATALGVVAWRNAGRSASVSRVAVARPEPTATPIAVAPAGAFVPLASASPSRPIPVATPTPAQPTATAAMPERTEVSDRAEVASRTAHVSDPATLAVAEPPASPETPQPRFRLQAISLRDGKPVAVLNDRMVYEGESFDGVSVVRIGEAEVELEIDGKRVVVGF